MSNTNVVESIIKTTRGPAFSNAAAGGQKGGWPMRLKVQDQARKGCRISYDDGRPGHQDARATVLEVTPGHGMLVQFDDRADTTYIVFSDPRWMDFIEIVE